MVVNLRKYSGTVVFNTASPIWKPEMDYQPVVKRFESSSGVTVFRLPLLAFPKHVTNCYLVMDEAVTLIDCASGWGDSNESLERCFQQLQDDFGQSVALKDVQRLIITHGHVDHYGGIPYVLEHAKASVGIHALDRSVVSNFAERLIVASKDVEVFLHRTGTSAKKIAELLLLYKWSKERYTSSPIDFEIEEGPLPDSPFVVYHTPGHCPGQICLRLDDLLFTADHVLERITPHQSPESITRNTGLGHYLDALAKIRLLDGIRLGLGGHEAEIPNVYERIDATMGFHRQRLDKTLACCQEPGPLKDIAIGLFGKREGYHILLALLETGAHLEYLYDRGAVVVDNYQDIEDDAHPVLRYRPA